MKNTGLFSFPVAALSVALLLPGLTYAQGINAEPRRILPTNLTKPEPTKQRKWYLHVHI